MTQKLDGTVAIITGGASGIGRALATEIVARGGEVVLADRQLDVAREVERGLRDKGGKATSFELDVRDRGAFFGVANDTIARTGRIDFLFNNAGIAIGGDIDGYASSGEDFDEVFDVNIRGVAHGILAVYPHMIARRSGHIVNTASVAGLLPTAGAGSYAAAKHAVVGLTKSLRIEAVRHGVRASVVCPGAIKTPILTGGRFGRLKLAVTDAAILKQWDRAYPMAPEVFARKTLDRVLANESIIVVPRWWKALWYLERLSPNLSMTIARRIHEQILAELEVDKTRATEAAAKPGVTANGGGGPNGTTGSAAGAQARPT
jgi:NAD(P)-dependent dehydrogenase (short-subunit alcohol dehydrogenase family)